DSILINPPTYGMYTICATTFNVATIKVPLTNEYQLDVEHIIAQKSQQPKLVFICSPNNPTGELMAQSQIVAVLEAYKDSALVVVDEAYIEFCADSTVTSLIEQYANLVVLRTLSKAYALAGIRCGFTLAQADTIAMMQKVIAPYPIPAPVEEIALQALSDGGIAKMRQQVSQLTTQKQGFIQQLTGLNQVQQIIRSDTNFVLLKVADKQKVLNAMQQHNILIRDQSSQPTLDNCVRITIGNPVQMKAVLKVLQGCSS
ncbi:MAG: histidinol-phosphate aminotransferase, partial [Alteromonadaceae bacterium]